jgi:4a-hydroxytetrahydrobiopterin dehydratase
MERLSDSEIAERLSDSSWRLEDKTTIVREFERASFADAVAFVNAIADLAERADHHPDVLIHDYKQVRLTLSTHSAGGLTERDFALAGAVDALP